MRTIKQLQNSLKGESQLLEILELIIEYADSECKYYIGDYRTKEENDLIRAYASSIFIELAKKTKQLKAEAMALCPIHEVNGEDNSGSSVLEMLLFNERDLLKRKFEMLKAKMDDCDEAAADTFYSSYLAEADIKEEDEDMAGLSME